jgi:hypothetical protein
MDKNLEMIFANALGKNSRISVDDPRDDVTSEDVQLAMNDIITLNIFNTSGGDLMQAASARLVTREVTELFAV